MNIANAVSTRVGGHAHRYLGARSRVGVVVSRFRHGFNVLFDENACPAFVAFQKRDVPLHPWAIEIPGLTRIPSNGTLSTVELDRIRVDGELNINTANAEVCELRIQPWTQNEANLARLRVPVIKDYYASMLTEVFTDPLIQQMEEDLGRRTGMTLEDLGREIIGAGIGSTPSGDDFIVGSLGVLWAIRTFSRHARKQIKGFRMLFRWEKLVERTPLPSAQMILAASDGCFPAPIPALLAAISYEQDGLIADATRTLATQGVTSGVQMLSGILEGLQNLDL